MATLEDFDRILADLAPASSTSTTAPAAPPTPATVTAPITAAPSVTISTRSSATATSNSSARGDRNTASKIAELEDMLADLGPSKKSNPAPSASVAAPPPVQTQVYAPAQAPAPAPLAPRQTTRKPSISVTMAAPVKKPDNFLLCGKCGNEITGTYINALDKNWHPEHFTCNQCSAPMKGNFFETDKGMICEDCASEFRCSECRQPITGTHLIYSDGRPVHTHCVPQSRCSRCNNALSLGDAHVEAMDKFWHPECFACTRCMTVLGSTFVQFEESPYCQNCIAALSKERNIVVR